MKTPEQVLDEIAYNNMISVHLVTTTRQLVITAMVEYAKIYHQYMLRHKQPAPSPYSTKIAKIKKSK